MIFIAHNNGSQSVGGSGGGPVVNDLHHQLAQSGKFQQLGDGTGEGTGEGPAGIVASETITESTNARKLPKSVSHPQAAPPSKAKTR